MKNIDSHLLILTSAMAFVAACGSQSASTRDSSASLGGAESAASASPSAGASCGNGNAGNSNATSSTIPTAWALVPASQGYNTRYSNTHGALFASNGNDPYSHRSLDGGNTWDVEKTDGNNCTVNVLTSDNNIVYGDCAPPAPPPGESIAEESIAAVSRDAGDTWENLTPAWLADVADPTNPNVAYGYESHKGDAGFGGTYVARDAGATWQRMTSEPNGFVTAVGPTANDLYVSENHDNSSQIFTAASHDGGVSWTRTLFKFADAQFAPATSSIVYAAAQSLEVDVSHDGGTSWQTIYPHCVLSVSVAPWDPSFVFAQTCTEPDAASGYVASTDGGQSWAGVPTPAGCAIINSIVFNADQHTISAACSNGIYKAATP